MILLHRLKTKNFKQLSDVTLEFPDQGTILIEGHNEAGKSSLFEAVYYGLYGAGLPDMNLADLKQYGAQEMQVELDFSINGRRFRVERNVRHNQKVKLLCPKPDGGMETIASTSEAGKRLQEELALSGRALLNTCFVEQKKLGQLEDLSKTVRREAINELLNIPELNALEKEFKPGREDSERIRMAKDRFEVAEMDAGLPLLFQERDAAQRCMYFRGAQEREVEITGLKDQIGAANQELRQQETRLTAIREDLQTGRRYETRLNAIQRELPPLLTVWENTILALKGAQSEEQELTALQETLPERRETLGRHTEWGVTLDRLEALELKAEGLRQELRERNEALAAYDILLQEWRAGEAKAVDLDLLRMREQEKYDRAKSAWEARQSATERDGRVALLFQQAAAYDTCLGEVEALDVELAHARQAEAELLPARERTGQLEAAERTFHRIAADELRRDEVGNQLRTQRGLQEDCTRDQELLVEQERALAALAVTHAENESRYNSMRPHARQAEQRKALLDWADAAERCAEADPNAGRMAEWHIRAAKAEEARNSAADKTAAAQRRTLPAIGMGLGGALLCVVALRTPFLVPLAILGGLLLAAGGLMYVSARKAVAAAQAAEETARGACQQLEGERGALQATANGFAGQLERRRAEEVAFRNALAGLEIPVPASPAEARGRVSSLPDMDLEEARRALEEVRGALNVTLQRQPDLEANLLRQRDRIAKQNIEEIARQIDLLVHEEAALSESLSQARGRLPLLLASLHCAEDSSQIQVALTSAQGHLAACEAAIARVPALGKQVAEKRLQAEDHYDEAHSLACELRLPGPALPEWRTAALEEREALQLARVAAPDDALRLRGEQANMALQARRTEIAVLADLQKRLQRSLEATPREDLADRARQCTEDIRLNDAAQTLLLGVRAALTAEGQPTSAHLLHTALSLVRQKLDADVERVAQLDAIWKMADAARLNRDRAAEIFAAAWRETVAEKQTPELPVAARTQLADIAAELESALQRLQIPGITQEREHLERTIKKMGEQNATREHQCARLVNERNVSLNQIGAPDTNTASLIAQFPELRAAGGRDSFEWETVYSCLQEKATRAQERRSTLAAPLNLDASPLVLEEEQAAWNTATQALEIKRCAEKIVQHTRQSIVGRVMPLTLENVRYLLPALTMGRYKDLDWREDDNTLLIYDERASAQKSKKVFSGGAKDQISLALRLGFALATQPTAKTTRPYWMFLDEPLSSFDRERSRALVDLLTKGVLRQRFHQIFLVSHSEAFDPGLFDYRIRMENGAVLEHNLPTPIAR